VRDSNVFTKTKKEAQRRSITVMSSLNEISTDQLGNGMVMVKGGGALLSPPTPTPFYSRLLDRYSKTT
jgi:hypothetical protein